MASVLFCCSTVSDKKREVGPTDEETTNIYSVLCIVEVLCLTK